jgi:membrane protein DedA with SNARE-associated domain
MTEAKVKAIDHDSYWIYSIIAFLIPFVGFIIGAIMLTKDTKLERKLGEHTIVISVLSIIIFGFLAMLWIVHANTTSISNGYHIY